MLTNVKGVNGGPGVLAERPDMAAAHSIIPSGYDPEIAATNLGG